MTVKGLAATLTPFCAGVFKNIAITINGGQPQVQAIEDAVLTAGLHWRGWSGQIYDAGSTPEGGGLRTIAEAGAPSRSTRLRSREQGRARRSSARRFARWA